MTTKQHKKNNPISVGFNEKQKFLDLFSALDMGDNKGVTKSCIQNLLFKRGIKKTDSRLKTLHTMLSIKSSEESISFDEFCSAVKPHAVFFERIVKGELAIPDFAGFAEKIEEIYNKTKELTSGEIASYIPQLARVDPNLFGVSICTIDGQRLAIGDANTPFCIQSTCKPINYCIAMELVGEDKVHKHVGLEPSGRSFNEIALNKINQPHNPMINAGAIMCSALIKANKSPADRFDHVIKTWENITGNEFIGFDNTVFLSESKTADRNFALAYLMSEMNAFPESTNINDTLDLYFQCCSIQANTNSMAVAAATLATGGKCPTNDKAIFSPNTVKQCLSSMGSCGMYDYSGEFEFRVGIPAKSGVSGALMMVIPNVMGISIWSPRLDEIGNSVRGVAFSHELVKMFNFHKFDTLVATSEKVDPRQLKSSIETDKTYTLIWASSQGDLDEIKRLHAYGLSLNTSDYDLRTPLHLAAAEGHLNVVNYLLNKGVQANAKDRWGNIPLDDAEKNGHKAIIGLLKTVTTE